MKKSNFLKRPRVIVIGLTLLLLVIVGFTNSSLAFNSDTGLTDRAELEAFMDGSIKAQLEAYNIAGATVAVEGKGSSLLLTLMGVCCHNFRKSQAAAYSTCQHVALNQELCPGGSLSSLHRTISTS